ATPGPRPPHDRQQALTLEERPVHRRYSDPTGAVAWRAGPAPAARATEAAVARPGSTPFAQPPSAVLVVASLVLPSMLSVKRPTPPGVGRSVARRGAGSPRAGSSGCASGQPPAWPRQRLPLPPARKGPSDRD